MSEVPLHGVVIRNAECIMRPATSTPLTRNQVSGVDGATLTPQPVVARTHSLTAGRQCHSGSTQAGCHSAASQLPRSDAHNRLPQRCTRLQGYLAYKKQRFPRTLR